MVDAWLLAPKSGPSPSITEMGRTIYKYATVLVIDEPRRVVASKG